MEEVKTIEGYSGYTVNKYGEVKNKKSGRILKSYKSELGEDQIDLYNKGRVNGVLIKDIVKRSFIIDYTQQTREVDVRKNVLSDLGGGLNGREIMNKRGYSRGEVYSAMSKEVTIPNKNTKVVFSSSENVYGNNNEWTELAKGLSYMNDQDIKDYSDVLPKVFGSVKIIN